MKTNAGGVANDVDGDNGADEEQLPEATELFCDLTQEQLDRFHDSIHMRTCKGTCSIVQAKPARRMFIMSAGRRSVSHGAGWPASSPSRTSLHTRYSARWRGSGKGMYECFAEA